MKNNLTLWRRNRKHSTSRLNVSFIRKLLSKFLKPAALQHRELHEILYKDQSNQLPGEKLVIGFSTRATLNRLLDAGDITPQQVQRFLQAAVAFLVRAVEYAMKKLLIRELLIKHANVSGCPAEGSVEWKTPSTLSTGFLNFSHTTDLTSVTN
ncbi:hypothetical protein JOQ06_021806 [Pogonophryne albipinna]|uniref:Uncharacterized protein n=1 Tax=Pogonophryne albipinna TaxID=1090488 RepID=A0AAD6A6D0_9TELE|nr:hypothetical protein JOQ06_021806 [Pogonophryne albipinna]